MVSSSEKPDPFTSFCTEFERREPARLGEPLTWMAATAKFEQRGFLRSKCSDLLDNVEAFQEAKGYAISRAMELHGYRF